MHIHFCQNCETVIRFKSHLWRNGERVLKNQGPPFVILSLCDSLGGELLRAQQHCVFTAVYKQFTPARAGWGLSSCYWPAARAFCCSNAALCSIMALIMVGLIAGLIAGDMGRSGYWLDFVLIKTHWKYGILPVI